MRKIAGLDLGEAWVGVAISDTERIIARPYTTYRFKELIPSLKAFLEEQDPEIIVVGNPLTLKGTQSEQTKKNEQMFQKLAALFPERRWLLWDERLTSSFAQKLQKGHSAEEKLKSHARAAAFILDSYLTFLKNNNFHNE